MCRTIHAILSTAICGVQMLVRVFMTVILMLENLIRMILQTLYNFISFMLQLLSLIPICVIFLVTTRLKCFMCGGGGPCPVNRGGACDCLMSAAAIVLLFFIFRSMGMLDKIFYQLGYVTAPKKVLRFVPTPGDVTECSREDNTTDTGATDTTTGGPTIVRTGDSHRYDYTETEIILEDSTTTQTATVPRTHALTPIKIPQPVTNTIAEIMARLDSNSTLDSENVSTDVPGKEVSKSRVTGSSRALASRSVLDLLSSHNLTTILYYIV